MTANVKAAWIVAVHVFALLAFSAFLVVCGYVIGKHDKRAIDASVIR